MKLMIFPFAVKPENTQLSVGSLNTSAVLLGSTVTFNCSTSSFPSPHVYWFYHNEVFIGSNVSGFYNLTMSRSGVYSCLPVNRAGVGETATVNLTVVGKLLYCTFNLSWGGLQFTGGWCESQIFVTCTLNSY